MQPAMRLLALCTRPDAEPRLLRSAAQAIPDWEALLREAEAHRLGPMLYHGLREVAQVPPEIRLRLQGIYLRSRLANQTRLKVMEEVYMTAGAAGITPLAYKGAALAPWIYPDAALRPMSDIDLLVEEAQARPLRELLLKQGFSELDPEHDYTRHRHLAPLGKQADGFTISLELHLALFSAAPRGMWGRTADLISPPAAHRLPGGVTAYRLGNEDMLMQLCRRLTYAGGEMESFRLQWVADLQAFLASYGAQLDWESLRRAYPDVPAVLERVSFLAPLPLRPSAARPPRGVGEYYRGWPAVPLRGLSAAQVLGYLGQTLFPSEWWLGLYYSQGGRGAKCFWPLHLANLLRQAVSRRQARLPRKP